MSVVRLITMIDKEVGGRRLRMEPGTPYVLAPGVLACLESVIDQITDSKILLLHWQADGGVVRQTLVRPGVMWLPCGDRVLRFVPRWAEYSVGGESTGQRTLAVLGADISPLVTNNKRRMP